MATQILRDVAYSPARDIYHLLPATMQTVAEHLIAGKPFQPMHIVMAEYGISEDEVRDAMNAYIRFMSLSHEDRRISMTDALTKSGWKACHPMAQIAVMFYTGSIMTGIFFEGAREATAARPTTPTMQAMLDVGVELTNYLHLPWWRRLVYRWKYKRRPCEFKG